MAPNDRCELLSLAQMNVRVSIIQHLAGIVFSSTRDEMTRNTWLVFPLILLCLALDPQHAHAQTINAASCNSSDVQAAINSVSVDGTTVAVPAGTCTWTSAVCPNNPGSGTCASPNPSSSGHSITLQGAGSSSTHIIVNIASGFGNDAFFVGNQCCNGKSFRLTGFDWQYESADSGGLLVFTQSTGYSVRIDNSTAEPYASSPGYGRFLSFSVPCISPGCVVDHNAITDLGVIVEAAIPGEALPGNTVWQQAMPFETVNAVYFENNTMNYPTFATHQVDIDCDDGGAYVFRYNTVYQNAIANHGYDSVYNGCRMENVYQNTINPNGVSNWGIQYRGGAGVDYNNVFSSNATGQNIGLTTYRMVYPAQDIISQNQPVCGYSNSKDGNGTDGYLCYEQTGAGSGANGGLVAYPLYEWDNCKVSSGCSAGSSSQVTYQVYTICSSCATDYTTQNIAQNRDFYGWQGTGCSGSQSKGVCVGLSSARASTCTSGVGYWATDTNTLYQCGPSNTWTAYYQPYTYPHPLDNSSPFPPTGLQAAVQ